MSAAHQPRFLFVGAHAAWRKAAEDVAARRGATLDVQPDVKAALAWMLPPSQCYDHVFAVAPLRSKAIDALAGMLDEVTLRPTPLLLLGCANSATATPMRCVEHPDADALAAAMGEDLATSLPSLPPMQPAEFVSTLHAGGLRMRFQPIVCASDQVPIGLEALARLHHTTRGILHPKDFIPLSIACGRERVLTGIAAARTFLEIGYRLRETGLFVTLNLPLASVMHESAVQRGIELCAVAGVCPRHILIEVLETRTAPDLGRLRHALLQWREAGFRTAIDDAGPALPHWREMLDLPFDVLKLDGAMVADPAQHTLLTTIVDEAKARNRFIIAEGIEDQACLDRVMQLGVDALQGFLFSRPLPAPAVTIWLEQWQRRQKKVA